MNAARPPLARLLAAPLLLALAAAPSPAPRAGVDVTVDAATVSELMLALTPRTVELPIRGGRPVTLHISDFQVLGFDPSDGEHGVIRTSLMLHAPELGLKVPMQPKIGIELDEHKGKPACLLRFRNVKLDVPMIGEVDISSTLPSVVLPALHSVPANGPDGPVAVETRLTDVLMGTTAIRLKLDVNVREVAEEDADPQ